MRTETEIKERLESIKLNIQWIKDAPKPYQAYQATILDSLENEKDAIEWVLGLSKRNCPECFRVTLETELDTFGGFCEACYQEI